MKARSAPAPVDSGCRFVAAAQLSLWVLWLVTLSSCDDGIGQPLRALPSPIGGRAGATGGGLGVTSAASSGEGGDVAGGSAALGGLSGQGGQAAENASGEGGSAGAAAGSGMLAPAACDTVSTWNSQDAQAEDSMLIALNAARSSGNACSNMGVVTPTLTMKPELQCAARLHVLDMVDRAYFDKLTPEGFTPEQRIQATGYVFTSAGESLWSGTQNDVLQQIYSNQGDCSNTANPEFTSAGVGHTGNYWVVDFTAH